MKTYPFLAVFICLCVNTAAQEYSFKYGKITPDELRMTLYEPEPDAPAVFIYDDTDIHYSFGNSIQLLCYRTVKIKVFKDEGVKWGDVAIDFGNYQLSKEVVSRIDAAAYNLVDGKTVKTQLKRQNIFEEVLDEHTKRLKFSIPEVRAGTVIEYRYLLTSDFIGQIPDVDVQHAIPVVRSTAQISIPEYFTHHIHTRGYLTLPVKKELENGGAAGFSGFSYTNTKYICNIDRVPSLRKEPYVWHLDDFRAGLEFEINGLEIPGSLYKSFTRTWADVYESLDRSEFGRYADIRNPFKDEVAAIVARNADDERRQLHEILKFVQSRIAWDGTYRLTPESSPHAAVDKRRGDSGSINFIRASITALRYANKTGSRLFVPVAPLRSGPGRFTAERRHDLWIDKGYCDTDSLTLHLPEGYVVEALPKSVTIENRFGKIAFEALCSGDRLHIRIRLLRRSGRYPQSEYAAFREFMQAVDRVYSAKIVLRKV